MAETVFSVPHTMFTSLQIRAERMKDIAKNGPNVYIDYVGFKSYVSIALMRYGEPSYVPFESTTTFTIQRTNSEDERKLLLLNYPHYAPADDGFTYYIEANVNKTFQPPIIVYVTKEDAAILEEKFKNI